MGQRGPQPKPVELKLLQGNPGNRPIDLSSMFRPEVGGPTIPKWLSAGARKVWKRLLPELLRYNLIATVDQDAFAMLCQTSARLAMIELALAGKERRLVAEGKDAVDALLDVTPNGLRIQSALYQVLNKEQEKLHKQLEGFGLRPDARARVTAAIRAQMPLELVPAAGEAGGQPAGPPTGFSQFD